MVRDDIDDSGRDERVTLDGIGGARAFVDVVALGLGAVLPRAGPLGGASLHIDHTDLSAFPTIIGFDDLIHRSLGSDTLFEQV